MATEFEQAPEELTFEYIYKHLYDYWTNIALNIFKWKGLEPISDLSSTIIEEQLYNYGASGFTKDAVIGFLCIKASGNVGRNVYGKPTQYILTGENGLYHKVVNAEDMVLIKNNNLSRPTADMVQFYCTKLAEIEMTKQLNLNANKMPMLIYTNEDTLLSDKNIFKQIRGCKPVIFKNKGVGDVTGKQVDVINSNTPYILDKLDDEYNSYVAKLLTLLGLDNYVEDKAERVQSAEVKSNQEYIIMNFKSMLDQRKKACEEINAKYGLNLSVEYVQGEQIEAGEDEQPQQEDEGGIDE